ncbi:hypothetical protein CBS101457_005744 [Exobasidium rhododendri]|nr:hypothetical protein CBS101457_005744 [Exobasidium rhododendri]
MVLINGVKAEEEEELEAEDDLFFEAGDEDESEDELAVTSSNQINFGDRLTPPRATTYSCSSLLAWIKSGKIDLEAEYQRDVVWSDKKQSALLDSIYRNWYVPPVLFSLRSVRNEDGELEEVRVCIDGKQRLTSIAKFMRNEIPIYEPRTNRAFYYKSSPKCLSQSKRDAFAQIQINCVEYNELNDDTEHEMFQRVQLGMQLSQGEKLAAKKGPWTDFSRELIKRFIDPHRDYYAKSILKLDRGKDFLFLGYICLLYLNREERKYTPSAQKLHELYELGSAPSAQQRKDIIDGLTRWTALANTRPYDKNLIVVKVNNHRRPLAPMEFLFTIYLCMRFPKASDSQLSSMFGELRAEVRREHKDVMINAKNEATIRDFILRLENQYPSLMASGGRRARDDEDDEYEPSLASQSRRRLE